MRDVKRIDKFCEKLAEYWKLVPDWRFGQLMVNFFGTLHIDPFFIEEEDMLKLLDDYFQRTW